MTSRGSATRYARALFDTLLAEHGDLVKAQEDLGGFASLVASNYALARALANPAIPADRKRGVVEQLIARSGSLHPAVAKLLLLLADRDRLGLLGELVEAFDERLLDYQRVVRAEIVTAEPLPAERVTELAGRLKTATGRDVRLQARVDESIIGGAITRIGSTVYDGSIMRQLERLRETLVSDSKA
jgi:F-type H+-transporting ATPase subunit delta